MTGDSRGDVERDQPNRQNVSVRWGKGRRERAGTNLQADHGEKQAVLVQEVKHLRGTQVSGARAGAVAMGRR